MVCINIVHLFKPFRQKLSLEVARVHRESRCGSVEGPPSHVDPVLLPPVGCGVAARQGQAQHATFSLPSWRKLHVMAQQKKEHQTATTLDVILHKKCVRSFNSVTYV